MGTPQSSWPSEKGQGGAHPCCVAPEAPSSPLQRIRDTVNSQEQKRLLMDLDVNMRTVDCFYTVTFYGALFREVWSWWEGGRWVLGGGLAAQAALHLPSMLTPAPLVQPAARHHSQTLAECSHVPVLTGVSDTEALPACHTAEPGSGELGPGAGPLGSLASWLSGPRSVP